MKAATWRGWKFASGTSEANDQLGGVDPRTRRLLAGSLCSVHCA